MKALQLRHLESAQDLKSAFAVMQELRPQLTQVEAFVEQVQRQERQGYRILAAWKDEEIVGLAGYRLQENLIYGRFLYVDDLVTLASVRSQGVGAALISAMREQAHSNDCKQLVLDTGLANALGQRFYFRAGLLARGLHFGERLSKD